MVDHTRRDEAWHLAWVITGCSGSTPVGTWAWRSRLCCSATASGTPGSPDPPPRLRRLRRGRHIPTAAERHPCRRAAAASLPRYPVFGGCALLLLAGSVGLALERERVSRLRQALSRWRP